MSQKQSWWAGGWRVTRKSSSNQRIDGWHRSAYNAYVSAKYLW
ncbi:hypothetical protein [Lascolabacillus sp.]|nr:hypothetical protein [Lascolabacillus sp.]MDD2607929.1 hypothetical protein [Lascolabacillus sp.]